VLFSLGVLPEVRFVSDVETGLAMPVVQHAIGDAKLAMQTGPKVFVVDDESVIAATLAIILNQSGFQAQSFTNPMQALEQARTTKPDLLISDVMMPEMTGIELAIAIKNECPECKILLFSGQAATADLLQVARSQGHEFHLLTKPVHPADLLESIRTL
jgi:CheY-like chemotaxis protein